MAIPSAVVFSWAGAAIVLEEAGTDTAAIWVAIGVVTTLYRSEMRFGLGLYRSEMRFGLRCL